MRSKIAILLVALVPALLLWLRWKAAAPPPAPPAAAPIVTAPKAAAPPAVAAKPVEAKKKAIVVEASPPYDFTKKPEGNLIPFRVVDGIAIAYGDVLLGEPDESGLEEGTYDAPTPQLWDRGEIPYAISAELPEPERVKRAIRYLQRVTEVRFVAYQGQPDAIHFEPGKEHCYSLLGKSGGVQPIKLAPACGTPEILHEIMHALGFIHEQSRTDRDRYVEVLWSNIDPKYKDQYAIVPDSFMEPIRNFPFDYRSAMLYRTDIFSLQSGQFPTMRSLASIPIAPVEGGLSEGDIERVNRYYHR